MANPILRRLRGDKTPQEQGPQRAVENYRERLRLAGIPDVVAAKEEDPRNVVEKALNLPKHGGLLQNLLDLISRPSYASAAIAKEVTDPERSTPLDVLKAGWRGLSGQERTTYSDVLAQAGMKPGAARTALGLALDVALDPTTYFSLGTTAAGRLGLKAAVPFTRAAVTVPGSEVVLKSIGELTRSAREAIAATQTGKALGKAFQGFRFRPAGVPEEEFRPWVERVEKFQTEYRAKPQEAMREAIEEGRRYTPEEQILAGQIRESPQLREALEKGAAQPISPRVDVGRVLAYAKKWENINRQLVAKAKSVGLKFEELEDYLAHVPGEEFGERAATLGGKTGPLRAYDPHARPRQLEGTVAEINARLGRQFFEPRMPIADAVRNARLERAIATQKFLNDIAANPRWAMPIKKGQTPPLGWRIWEPEGPFRFYPLPEGKGFGVTKQVTRYAVPEYVAEYLDEAMRTFKDDAASRQVRDLWRTLQGFWVSSVTSLNPAYHSRNIQGNVFNAWLAGLKSPRPYFDALGIQLGKEGTIKAGLSYDEVLRLFRQEGLDTTNFFSGEGGDMVKQVRQALTGKGRSLVQRAKDLTSAIETNSKLALFIDQLNKGAAPEEAARVVKKYLFDYQDLTPLERKLKRFFPFYTWSRKNIPLQFESMVTQPGKYALVAKGKRSVEELSPQEVPENELPEWFKEEYAIRTPFRDGQGNQLYWIPNLPFVDLNTLNPRDIYSRLSPFIKLLPDLLTGQNISLGIPFERYEGQTVEWPGGFRVPAWLDYIVKQFGVARNVGNVAATLQGLPGSKDKAALVSQLAGFTMYPVNPEKAKENTAYRLQKEYADYLNRLEEQGKRPPTLTELRRQKNPILRKLQGSP